MSAAIIANGELQPTHNLAHCMAGFNTIIAVDGGLTHCARLKIQPHLLVGDFDSVTPDLLDTYSHVRRIALPRDKDVTDLEVALAAVRASNAVHIAIFAALGGRLDHSLGNIHLLLRHPGPVTLETAEERFCAVQKSMVIPCAGYSHLSLLRVAEIVRGVCIRTLTHDRLLCQHAVLDERLVVQLPSTEHAVEVEVIEGTALCILHSKYGAVPSLPHEGTLSCAFTLQSPMQETLLLLSSLCTGLVQATSEHETVIPLNALQRKITLPCRIGLTISLIPMHGPVSGVCTQGLKWELSDATLHGGFLSLSNVCCEESFSVQIATGELLCIINKDLIEQMDTLETSSAPRLAAQSVADL